MITANIEQHAARDGDRVAVRYGNLLLSYSQFVQEVDKLAQKLLTIGIGPGLAVASICENRVETLLLYYAVGKVGGTFISINNSLTVADVAYILCHAKVSLLLHDEKMADVAAAATQNAPEVCTVAFADFAAANPLIRRDKDPALEGVFQIAYTSGSTGRPKAVALDQVNEEAGNRSLIELWGMQPTDITVVALPLGFLYGLSTQSSMTLQAGGEVVLLRRFHPKEVLEAFVQHRASVFHGVPTMFAMMLEYAEQNNINIDLSFMRLLVSAGAPLSNGLRARFENRFKKTVDNYYATTEVRPVFGKYANDNTPIPENAIGKAAPGVRIRIVDSYGNDVRPGEAGELLVHAPSTALGYYKNPELTQGTFQNGMMRTGDLCSCDAQGFYYLTGRIKDIIIRGGANISPVEVEEVIQSHPDVQQVAVIGVPDEIFGQTVAAFVVAKNNNHPSSDELITFCKTRLAEFKAPSHLIWVSELPLGITAKVDKKALLAGWLAKSA